MTQLDPATRTYEDGVRDCIRIVRAEEALDKEVGEPNHFVGILQALEALLPDRAEELVRSLCRDDEAMSREYSDGFDEACRRITQNYTLEKK